MTIGNIVRIFRSAVMPECFRPARLRREAAGKALRSNLKDGQREIASSQTALLAMTP
jgi:hypothetical protein